MTLFHRALLKLNAILGKFGLVLVGLKLQVRNKLFEIYFLLLGVIGAVERRRARRALGAADFSGKSGRSGVLDAHIRLAREKTRNLFGHHLRVFGKPERLRHVRHLINVNRALRRTFADSWYVAHWTPP